MTEAARRITDAVERGELRRMHSSEAAIYTALCVVLGDGPKVLTLEAVAHLSGVSRSTAAPRLARLVGRGLVRFERLPGYVKSGRAARYTGRFSLPPVPQKPVP